MRFLGSEVSIPYRYATNAPNSKWTSELTRVSIPYRYATNFLRLLQVAEAFLKFQFLIGTLQTFKKMLDSVHATMSFNSL